MKNATFSFKMTPFSGLVPPMDWNSATQLFSIELDWERMLDSDTLLKFLKAQLRVWSFVFLFNNSDNCLSWSQPTRTKF